MSRHSSYALLVASVLALAAPACETDDGGPGVRLEILPQRLGVPAGLNPVWSHNFLVDGAIPTEHARFAAETGVAWGEWARVQPARAALIITEPGLNWDFVTEVILKGYRDDPTAQVELFYRDPVPQGLGARLDLVPADLDVQDLLSGDTYGLILELRRLGASPPQSFPVVVEYSWEGIPE